MAKESKKTPKISSVREDKDREQLSKICNMWDSDPKVSLICYAMRDESDGTIHGMSLVMTNVQHAFEIIYRLAKALECPCGRPECLVTECAQSLVAVMDQKRAQFQGDYVQH
jgi:hypothetical protein